MQSDPSVVQSISVGRMHQPGNCFFAWDLREDDGGASEQYLPEDRGEDQKPGDSLVVVNN